MRVAEVVDHLRALRTPVPVQSVQPTGLFPLVFRQQEGQALVQIGEFKDQRSTGLEYPEPFLGESGDFPDGEVFKDVDGSDNVGVVVGERELANVGLQVGAVVVPVDVDPAGEDFPTAAKMQSYQAFPTASGLNSCRTRS